MQREIPLYTHEGVRDADISNHWFTTPDRLGLTLTRFRRKPCDDVVLLIHGLTTSTDMFIMPEHYNLVQFLLDNGLTDVWSLDFRMSNRFSYNLQPHRFNMDDVAMNDMPAALEELREHVGDRPIHVICHCLGSVSFMLSLFGRASRGVSSVISNSVALTPRLPRWSLIKLTIFPFFVDHVLRFDYLNPRWSEDRGITLGKIFSKTVSLFHRECDEPSCHMLSIMWGTGWPALYHHENLQEVTHRRGADLFGGTSMHYYRHVRKMAYSKNTAVKFHPEDPRYESLPDDYFQYAAHIRTPILLVTGATNRVFTDSNVECHRRLEELAPGRHELHVYPGYGHQDVFMGKNNHLDTFPRMLDFIERNRGKPPGDADRREGGAAERAS